MQSVLITTNVVNSNPTLVKVYSIYYVIKFVSDLQYVKNSKHLARNIELANLTFFNQLRDITPEQKKCQRPKSNFHCFMVPDMMYKFDTVMD
jgi:hypothetical protein